MLSSACAHVTPAPKPSGSKIVEQAAPGGPAKPVSTALVQAGTTLRWGNVECARIAGNTTPFAQVESSCNLDPRECAKLAPYYSCGIGVPVDRQRAITVADRACGAGSRVGCAIVGHALLSGTVVPRDVERGSRLVVSACDDGEDAACVDAGLVVLPRDGRQAMHDFQRACDADVVEGCIDFAVKLSVGLPDVPPDVSRAEQVLDSLCSEGEATACANLASIYYDGRSGVTRDAARAAMLARRGCDGGEIEACNMLAVLLWNGDGVAVDAPQAVILWQRCCNAGSERLRRARFGVRARRRRGRGSWASA